MSRNTLISVAIAIVTAFSLHATPVAAQARSGPAGVRVRVKISDSGGRVIGELGALTRDSVTVRPVGGIEVRLLQPRTGDVERSAGYHHGPVETAAALGFFAGYAYGHQAVGHQSELVEATGDMFVSIPMGLVTAALTAAVTTAITGERWVPESFPWESRGTARSASRQVRVRLDSGTTVKAVGQGWDNEVVGRLLFIDADSVRVENESGVHVVSRSTLRSFEVKGEKDKRTASLLWGGAAFVLTAMLATNDLRHDRIAPVEAAAAVAGNALIFGAIGTAFAPTHWESVPCWLGGRPAAGSTLAEECEVAMRAPSAHPPR